eukprot:3797929-Prymnesium_polylepis.1
MSRSSASPSSLSASGGSHASNGTSPPSIESMSASIVPSSAAVQKSNGSAPESAKKTTQPRENTSAAGPQKASPASASHVVTLVGHLAVAIGREEGARTVIDEPRPAGSVDEDIPRLDVQVGDAGCVKEGDGREQAVREWLRVALLEASTQLLLHIVLELDARHELHHQQPATASSCAE